MHIQSPHQDSLHGHRSTRRRWQVDWFTSPRQPLQSPRRCRSPHQSSTLTDEIDCSRSPVGLPSSVARRLQGPTDQRRYFAVWPSVCRRTGGPPWPTARHGNGVVVARSQRCHWSVEASLYDRETVRRLAANTTSHFYVIYIYEDLACMLAVVTSSIRVIWTHGRLSTFDNGEGPTLRCRRRRS